MLAKMPQKTANSPFRNKLTIISLVVLMGLGLSAAYFTVPFIQSPIPAPNSLIGNTTNNTVSSPVSHTNISGIKIQDNSTPTTNTTSTANTTSNITSTQNTDTNKQSSNLGQQNNNAPKTSTNSSKTSTTSKTTQSTKNITNTRG